MHVSAVLVLVLVVVDVDVEVVVEVEVVVVVLVEVDVDVDVDGQYSHAIGQSARILASKAGGVKAAWGPTHVDDNGSQYPSSFLPWQFRASHAWHSTGQNLVIKLPTSGSSQ